MKFIQNVRVAIYGSDLAMGKVLAASLADFGMPLPMQSLTLEDLGREAAGAEIIIVHLPWTDRQHTSSLPEAVRKASGRGHDLPFILMVDQADRPLVRLAAAAGYSAVVPVSHGARGIYRKIGAVLQHVRRSAPPPETVPAASPAWPGDGVRVA